MIVPMLGLGQGYEFYMQKGEEYELIGEWDKVIDSYSKSIYEIEKLRTDAVYVKSSDKEVDKWRIRCLLFWMRGRAYVAKATTAEDKYYSARLGFFWYNEEWLQLAVSDFTKSISIMKTNSDKEFDLAYFMRGKARQYLDAGKGTIDFCSDYKKACDLGKDDGCKSYYTKCK